MNFYANHNFGRSQTPGRHLSGRLPTARSPANKSSKHELKEDRILDMRVKSLMEKYKDDPQSLDTLKNKLEALLINISITRDLNLKNQEKKLRKEFIDYLNTL